MPFVLHLFLLSDALACFTSLILKEVTQVCGAWKVLRLFLMDAFDSRSYFMPDIVMRKDSLVLIKDIVSLQLGGSLAILLELNDAANDATSNKIGIGFIDLVKGVGARDQLVELDFACFVHLQQVGDIVEGL